METVCVDIREELMTQCRGMERPGHEIAHLGGTMEVEKSNVCPYQYILDNINFSLRTAMEKKRKRKYYSTFVSVHTVTVVHNV